VDIVGSERDMVPDAPVGTSLVRCAECQRISIAGIMKAEPSTHDSYRSVECRTPLGRFEGGAWVPIPFYVNPLLL
jgi:hypothetical protein